MNTAIATIAPDEELASIARVKTITGLGKSTIYRLIREGKFPEPIRVGSRSLRPVSWIHGWVNEQIASARSPENVGTE